jgi:uncharacterized protein YneR
MATGLKSRIIYRVKTKETSAEDYWAGEYQLLIRAKSIPSPFGSPNMVDTSTLEDLVETQEFGRTSAGSMEVSGAFEKKYKDSLVENEGNKLDMCVLYGTDGKGSEGIVAFIGEERFTPDEATDDHLTGTSTIAVSTVPRWIEDDYTVTVEEDDNGYPTKITLTKKS